PQAFALAERAGEGEAAALLRAKLQLGVGDLPGARRAASVAASGRDAVLGRARLAVLVATIDPAGTGAAEALAAARAELDPLARKGDGVALALLGWAEDAAGDAHLARGDEAVAKGGGAEAHALRARERLALGDVRGAA